MKRTALPVVGFVCAAAIVVVVGALVVLRYWPSHAPGRSGVAPDLADGAEDGATNGERMVEGLVERGLPITPPEHRASKQRLVDKSVEELVKIMGDPWVAAVTADDINWDYLPNLAMSLPRNVILVRLVEEGRRDRQRVGRLVSADLRSRIERLPEVYRRYREAAAEAPGGLGFAVSEKGGIQGSQILLRFSEDNYAILAAMWVLANIDYREGIDAIQQFGSLISHPVRLHFKKRDMVNTYFAPEMPVYALYVLLKDNDDPAYAEERRLLVDEFGDMPIVQTVVVNRSDALYPTGHFPLSTTDVDASSEPTITVTIPDVAKLDTLYDFNEPWGATDAEKLALLEKLWKAAQRRQARAAN